MRSTAVMAGTKEFVPGGKKAYRRLLRGIDSRTKTALEQSRNLALSAQTRFVIWRDMPRPEPRY